MEISQNLSKSESWKIRVEEWKASKKSIRQWCIECCIHESTFIYWKNKFSEEVLSKKDFVEILEEEVRGIEIHCKGFEIHVGKEFDELTLARCLKLIRSSSC